MRIEFVREAVGKAAVPIAFLVCTVMTGLVVANYLIVNKVGNDFSVYLRTAGAPVEAAYGFPGEFPFPYAPTMLFLLKSFVRPLMATPGIILYVGFACISLILYRRALERYVPMTGVVLCLISPAVARGAMTGQLSIILAAFAIWAIAQKDRVLTGLAFGLIAAIKPQLVIMAPLFFIVERDWKALMWSAVAFLSVLAAALVAYGTQPWFDWVASMPKFHAKVLEISAGGIGTSPALMAEHFGLSPVPFIAVGLILGTFLTIYGKRGDALQNAAIISLGSLLASPYSLAYDLAGVVPFLALMTLRGNIFAGLAMGTPFMVIPMGVTLWGLLPTKPRISAREPRAVTQL